MSALDKIKKAIAPSESNELAGAIAKHAAERERMAQLTELRARLVSELDNAKRPLGDLSLNESEDGRKRYDAALSEVERLERDLRHNADAQAAIRAKLQTIAERIGELKHAEALRALTRQGSKRQKKADELQDALVGYVDAYQAFYNVTEEIVTAWPAVAESIGLDIRRVPDSIAVELYRLWPVSQVARNARSAMPGAHNGLGLDDPRLIPVLSEAVRQESAAALSKLKASGISEQQSEQQPATVTADEVMTSLKPVHIEITPATEKAK